MTTTLSARGQLVIPSKVRKELGLREGDDFTVLYSATGEIRLMPIRRGRRKTFYQALRAMEGLEVVHEDEPIRDVVV